MDAGFFTVLEKARGKVNDCTATILKDVQDEKLRTKYLKEIEDVLTGLVSCEHKVAVTRQAVKEATNRALDEGLEQISADVYDDLVEESISELEQDSPLEKAVAEAMSLKVFNQQLMAADNASAAAALEVQNVKGDLVTMEVTQSFIDPISKKRMTDPVRNKNCQHVYDRESITNMIKMRRKFRCPAMGCANRAVIKLSDLEEAPDVKRQLALA